MRWITIGAFACLLGCSHTVAFNGDDDIESDAQAPVKDAGSKPLIEASADVGVDPDAGTDPGDAAPEADPDTGVPTPMVVFVSSALYDGNLGGLTGADSKCQGLATAASLPGTFKAWLSDSMWGAAQRLTHSKMPYILVDNTIVANDWKGLTSGNLSHAINLTEKGLSPPKGTYGCGSDPTVWSYTNTSGMQAGGGNCSDWSSTATTTAHAGSLLYKSWAWTDYCQISGTGMCAKTAALYCIQQ